MIENKTKTEEEKLIEETIKFQEAWTKGDARTISQFFTEDGRRVGSFGEISNGRSEVEKAYKMLLERALPGAKLLTGSNTVKFLSSELAIWQGSFEILNPGVTSKIKGYTVQIMKKENDRWMILEMHPKIFPLQEQVSI